MQHAFSGSVHCHRISHLVLPFLCPLQCLQSAFSWVALRLAANLEIAPLRDTSPCFRAPIILSPDKDQEENKGNKIPSISSNSRGLACVQLAD